jgi:hypothetical protein
MKRFAFAIGVLALGFAATTPARADWAITKFELGYCRIWFDTGMAPWGTGWKVIAKAPTFEGAWAAQDAAVKKGKCK